MVEEQIRKFANQVANDRGLELTINELQRVEPVLCDSRIQEAIKKSIQEEVDVEAISLPSGAGHDGMQFKHVAPIGMIFVRSKDGISHNPKEFTSEEDIEKAGNVLYRTLLELDRE